MKALAYLLAVLSASEFVAAVVLAYVAAFDPGYSAEPGIASFVSMVASAAFGFASVYAFMEAES